MDYHLYYHDDFDGMASGAVMLNFLCSRGDDIFSFNPIDYTPEINETWPRFKFKKPFILVDFRYHKKAAWWFDHHGTSFKKPALASWKRGYQNDAFHCCDPKPKSCCSLILAHLQKYWRYNPPEHIKDLAGWSDKEDSYTYESAREVIESRTPPLKLASYTNYEKNKRYRIRLVKLLASGPISRVILQKRVAQKIRLSLTDTRKAIKKLPELSFVRGKVIFADAAGTVSDISHFLVYAVYPESKYSVIFKKQENFYHLGVGFNPWQKDKNRINIGGLMSKYGGGGHKVVGAVEKKSKKEIMKIAEKIIEYLNKHG